MKTRAIMILALGVLALLLSPLLGQTLDGQAASFILYELRLPRVFLGLLVGAALGLSGAAFQIVLENPLATPSTVGTTAGASLGALAVLVLWPGGGSPSLALGAFVGAVSVSLGLAFLAAQARLRTEELLLAGIAITLAAGAATAGLQLQADAVATVASVRWSLGSLSTVGWRAPTQLFPWVFLGGALILSQLRALQAMAGGAERSATQGVPLVRTRTIILLAGSLSVSACVAITGPIAFVGLIVPHVVRRLLGESPRILLPFSTILGATFLPLCDGLARSVVPERDLPVGVITAGLGAPALLYLLLQRRR
jgi:ABC-type Fe3+-siderophore transport system permease subunit